MLGKLIFGAHAAFQALSHIIWPEPTRYALAKWRMRQVMKPIDRQIAAARRRNKPVAHLQAAKTALVHQALERAR
jgi:hypothetical protein